DRVEVPTRGAGTDRAPVLLADDVVVREPLGEPGSEGRLDVFVDLRHERPVRLRLDGQLLTQPTEGQLVGDVSAGDGEVEPIAEVARIGAAEAGAPVGP